MGVEADGRLHLASGHRMTELRVIAATTVLDLLNGLLVAARHRSGIQASSSRQQNAALSRPANRNPGRFRRWVRSISSHILRRQRNRLVDTVDACEQVVAVAEIGFRDQRARQPVESVSARRRTKAVLFLTLGPFVQFCKDSPVIVEAPKHVHCRPTRQRAA